MLSNLCHHPDKGRCSLPSNISNTVHTVTALKLLPPSLSSHHPGTPPAQVGVASCSRHRRLRRTARQRRLLLLLPPAPHGPLLPLQALAGRAVVGQGRVLYLQRLMRRRAPHHRLPKRVCMRAGARCGCVVGVAELAGFGRWAGMQASRGTDQAGKSEWPQLRAGTPPCPLAPASNLAPCSALLRTSGSLSFPGTPHATWAPRTPHAGSLSLVADNDPTGCFHACLPAPTPPLQPSQASTTALHASPTTPCAATHPPALLVPAS